MIGILVVYFTNLLFAESFGDESWRWMLGSEAIPAVLFFLLLFIIPESPRWLYKNNQIEKARGVLRKLEGEGNVQSELADIEKTLQGSTEKAAFGDLFKGGMKKVLAIGVILAMFQQLVGINAVIYYAPTIFASAGAGLGDALAQNGCHRRSQSALYFCRYLVGRQSRASSVVAGRFRWHDGFAKPAGRVIYIRCVGRIRSIVFYSRLYCFLCGYPCGCHVGGSF